eukprot:352013-Chlamydomonas_euryale.AAC.2
MVGSVVPIQYFARLHPACQRARFHHEMGRQAGLQASRQDYRQAGRITGKQAGGIVGFVAADSSFLMRLPRGWAMSARISKSGRRAAAAAAHAAASPAAAATRGAMLRCRGSARPLPPSHPEALAAESGSQRPSADRSNPCVCERFIIAASSCPRALTEDGRLSSIVKPQYKDARLAVAKVAQQPARAGTSAQRLVAVSVGGSGGGDDGCSPCPIASGSSCAFCAVAFKASAGHRLRAGTLPTFGRDRGVALRTTRPASRWLSFAASRDPGFGLREARDCAARG